MTDAFNRNVSPLEDIAAVVGRILLMVLFLVSGWTKLMAGPAAIGAYFAKVGVPAPTLAYYVALLVELPLAALFLIGWQTRSIALILAAWSIGSALFGHANVSDPNQWIHFMKNLGLAGGFLYAFAHGGGRYSVDGRLSARNT